MRLVLMNCSCSGIRPARFAATIPSQSGKMRRSRVKVKMSSWKMSVRTRGCTLTMCSIIRRHSSASRRAIGATLPWASCRKLVAEQNVHPIGQ